MLGLPVSNKESKDVVICRTCSVLMNYPSTPDDHYTLASAVEVIASVIYVNLFNFVLLSRRTFGLLVKL